MHNTYWIMEISYYVNAHISFSVLCHRLTVLLLYNRKFSKKIHIWSPVRFFLSCTPVSSLKFIIQYLQIFYPFLMGMLPQFNNNNLMLRKQHLASVNIYKTTPFFGRCVCFYSNFLSTNKSFNSCSFSLALSQVLILDMFQHQFLQENLLIYCEENSTFLLVV